MEKNYITTEGFPLYTSNFYKSDYEKLGQYKYHSIEVVCGERHGYQLFVRTQYYKETSDVIAERKVVQRELALVAYALGFKQRETL
jgi:hypothetical protein